MDLSRYLDIATRGRLFFSRQDKFRDTFEGAIPLKSRFQLAEQSKRLEESYKKTETVEDRQVKRATMERAYMRHLDDLRRMTFISCWHMNAGESAAMWDLYGRNGSAIAFRTSYQKLRDALPSAVFLGMVRYIDFETESFGLGNAFNVLMHKRRSFEHEKEVRAVIQHVALDTGECELNHDLTEFGLTVPFDLNEAIEEIRVSPEAKPWFFRMIQETNSKLGVVPPVSKSSLYDNVIF